MSQPFDLKTVMLQPGLSVVEASAGTGKTFSLSFLVPRFLLQDESLRFSEILLVTFTNDAAGELADRVRWVLHLLWQAAAPNAPATGNEVADAFLQEFGRENVRRVLGRALREVDRLAVMTIHAFCLRVLQTEGHLCGVPVVPEVLPETTSLIGEILADLWEDDLARRPLLATLARAGHLSLDADRTFVTKTLAHAKTQFDPPATKVGLLWRKVRRFHQNFPGPLQADLLREFASVPRWKRDAPAQSLVAEALDTLSQPFNTRSLEAARLLAGLPDQVNHQGNMGKAKAEALRSHQAVQQAQSLLDLVGEFSWQRRIALVERLRSEVARRLRRQRCTTYDDLLATVHQAVTPSQETAPTPLALRLGQLYRVALIDESQDTDARQFEIFERIFLRPGSGHRLVLIGDPKQAIYGFRGADVNSYLRAKQKAGAERHFTLTKTYRAPAKLVESINVLFSAPQALLKPGLDFIPATSACSHRWLAESAGQTTATDALEAWVLPVEMTKKSAQREEAVARAVAAEIVRLLHQSAEIVEDLAEGGESRRPVGPGDCAVLVSTARQAQVMANALRRVGLPVILARAGQVLESEEAADLLLILRALEQPRRLPLVRTALATRLLGHNLSELMTPLSGAVPLPEGPAAAEAALSLFLEWHNLWYREGIAAVLGQLERHVAVRLARHEAGERRLTNLRHLVDLLQAAEVHTGRRPGLLRQWLAQAIAAPVPEAEEGKIQLETEAQAVRIVTMHAAKGLEYPLVFCPFLWHLQKPEGLQTLAQEDGVVRIFALAEKDERASKVFRQILEERLRLAYVALTRAKVKAWFVAGVEGGSHPKAQVPPSALDWLLSAGHDGASSSGVVTDQAFAEWWKGALAQNAGRRQRHLEVLRQRFSSFLRVREITSEDLAVCPWQPPVRSGAALRPLPPPRISPWRGLTSFSALTREQHRHADAGPPAPWGEESAESASAGEEASPASAVSPREESCSAPEVSSLRMLDLALAPGSPKVGSALHEWIEQWDLAGPPDVARLEAHLASYLLPDFPGAEERNTEGSGREAGGANARWLAAVVAMLEALREARLPGLNGTVAQACGVVAASEWKFLLPLTEKLTPGRLADVFAQHGEADYARRLRQLTFAEVRGFLEGVIDRLACFKGCWGVVDWKSNKLGPTPAAYDAPNLLRCAQANHYYLQAHLYLVALRRFLPPGTPVVGAWLVFLRGLVPHTHRGILFIHPSPELLKDLDKLF